MADEAPSPVDEEKDKLLYGAFKESETSSRRKYVYTTLQEDEIRLVTLLPQSAGLPIFCNMSHVSLESEPIYEALSYTWGAREALTTISFNDRTMVVRRNLWMALSHLRHLTEPRVLWIDAICIDQSNNDERRSQVSKMFKIYEQASMVAVWLGEQEDGSDRAFESLEIIAKFASNRRSGEDLLEENAVDTTAILTLCQRTYWKRLWIIQELQAAKRIELYCGSKVMAWATFRRVVGEKYLWKLLDEWLDLRASDSITSSPAGVLVRRKRSTTSTLKRLLYLHANSQCEDPRDKIYGLLSLASDCQNGGLRPDYSISTCQLYHNTMLWCCDTSPSARIEQVLNFSTLLLRTLGDPFWDDQTLNRSYRDVVDIGSNHQTFSVTLQPYALCPPSAQPILEEEISFSVPTSEHWNRKWASTATLHVNWSEFRGFMEKFLRERWLTNHQYLDKSYEQHRILGPSKLSLVFMIQGNDISSLVPGFGLSTCRIEQGDRIFQMPNLEVFVVVRPNFTSLPPEFQVVGRVIEIESWKFYRDIGTVYCDPDGESENLTCKNDLLIFE
jgi:hypothetical protein